MELWSIGSGIHKVPLLTQNFGRILATLAKEGGDEVKMMRKFRNSKFFIPRIEEKDATIRINKESPLSNGSSQVT